MPRKPRNPKPSKLQRVVRRSAAGVDPDSFVWADDEDAAFAVFVNKTGFEPTQRHRLEFVQVDPTTVDPARILNPEDAP